MTNKTHPVIWEEYVKKHTGYDIMVDMFYKVGEPGLFCNISMTETINGILYSPLLQAIEEKIEKYKQQFDELPDMEKTSMGKGQTLALYSAMLSQLLQAIITEKERLNNSIRKLGDTQNVIPVK